MVGAIHSLGEEVLHPFPKPCRHLLHPYLGNYVTMVSFLGALNYVHPERIAATHMVMVVRISEHHALLQSHAHLWWQRFLLQPVVPGHMPGIATLGTLFSFSLHCAHNVSHSCHMQQLCLLQKCCNSATAAVAAALAVLALEA